MIRPVRNLLDLYEKAGLDTLSYGERKKYDILSHYENRENYLLSEYTKEYSDMYKVKNIEYGKIQKTLSDRNRNLNLYLMYNGLSGNAKATKIVSANNAVFDGKLLDNYNLSATEQSDALEARYRDRIQTNFHSYEKSIASRPFLELLDTSRIADKVSDNQFSINNTTYTLTEEVLNTLYFDREFLNSLKAQGFREPYDTDIPDGFYIQSKGVLSGKTETYIHHEGKWFMTRQNK